MGTFLKTMEPPGALQFKKPGGRPFRTISIETEVDGDGYAMAQDLHDNGVCVTPRVERYGFFPQSYSCIGFIKQDGSVTGGEYVMDRINLTLPTHARALYRAFEILHKLEKNGTIACNPNCGGHITIDGGGFGHFDVLRLVTLFGFLEEPIFRLAGAGCKYGHRSLYKGHDIANGGRGYANVVVKGPFKAKPHIFGGIMGQQRMCALNLTKFMQAQCHGCGNITHDHTVSVTAYGDRTFDLKTCSCSTNRGGSGGRAIEWRVWNATTNPKILYAWIAVMQAAHAYSWRPAGPYYTEFEDMPVFEWTQKPYRTLTEKARNTAQERVEWMFSELPLNAEEKKALAYAYMRTPYKAWGRPFFTRMANTPYKPPPYPNEYTPSFKRVIQLSTEKPQQLEVEEEIPFEYEEVPNEVDRPPVAYYGRVAYEQYQRAMNNAAQNQRMWYQQVLNNVNNANNANAIDWNFNHDVRLEE